MRCWDEVGVFVATERRFFGDTDMHVRAYRHVNRGCDGRSDGRARRSRRVSNAFSLIEVLIVVATIAVLLGVLMPVLGSARERGREVACSARLRQWGTAFACYANENGGMWPHCDGLDRNPGDITDPSLSSAGLADWHGWVDVLPPLLSEKPWREFSRFGYPGSTSFYQCPTARLAGNERLYSYRPTRDGYFSYAMNACLVLDENAWPPPGGEGYPMPSFVDSGRIVQPSTVVLLFDQLLDPTKGFDGDHVYRGAGEHCGSYPKSFSARHRRGLSKLGGNLLYADGHVGWVRSVWKSEWDADQEVPPRSDTNWYPFPAGGEG